MSRLPLQVFILVLLFFCAGCLESEKVLVISQDGSGELKISMRIPNDVADSLAKMRTQMDGRLPVIIAPFEREEIEALAKTDGIAVVDLGIEPGEETLSVSYKVVFDDLATFARQTAPKLMAFRIARTNEGDMAFTPLGVWDNFSRELTRENREQVEAHLAMLRMQLRGGVLRVEVVLPEEIKKVVGGTKEGNRAVWKWTPGEITFDNLLDAEGKAIIPEATIAGAQLKLELPLESRSVRPRRPDEIRAAQWSDAPLVERTDEESAQMFTYTPTRYGYNISANRHGESMIFNRSNELRVDVACPTNIYPVSAGQVVIDEMIGGDGRALASEGLQTRANVEGGGSYGVSSYANAQKKVRLTIPLGDAESIGHAIGRISGHFELCYAKRLQEVRIELSEAVVGSRIEVEGKPELEIKLEARTADSITLNYGKEVYSLIHDIRFLGPDGKALGLYGSSGGSSKMQYRLSIPEGGAMVISLYDQLHREVVPIRLKDIPLTIAPEADLPLFAEEGMDFSLSGMSARRQIDFKGGRPEKISGNASFNLRLTCPPNVQPVRYWNLQFEIAESDAGTDFVDRNQLKNLEQNEFRQPGGRERPEINISVPALDTIADARMIKRLKGSFRLRYSEGLSKSDLAPVGTWVGRRAEIPGRPEIDLGVEKIAPDFLVLRLAHETRRNLARIEIRSGDGSLLDNHTRRTEEAGEHVFQEYAIHEGKMTPEASVSLYFHTDAKDVLVPFDLRDIRLKE